MNLLSRLARLEQAAAAIHIEPARIVDACARIEELERLDVEGGCRRSPRKSRPGSPRPSNGKCCSLLDDLWVFWPRRGRSDDRLQDSPGGRIRAAYGRTGDDGGGTEPDDGRGWRP